MRCGLLGVMLSITATGAAAQGYGSVESGEKLEVLATGLHVEEDCRGRKADLNGSDLVVRLSGICAGVEVVGSGNRVSATIAEGGPLHVYGSDNEIEWTSSGEVPVEVVGQNNRVRRTGN